MTNESYTLDMPGLHESSLPSPVIPPPASGEGKFADDLSRVDRYPRLAQAQYRGVRVGSFGFVLEPTVLYEIIEYATISPLPGVTSICKGLINHRSNVVPVYDITELTDTTPPIWKRKRLLILDSRENAVGVLLYDLPVQIGTGNRIQPHEIMDVPKIFCRHASGAYWNNDSLWLILDRESFFAELNGLCLQFE